VKRKIVDIILFVLFLLVMDFRNLPRALHEDLGIIVLVFILVHLWLNRSWFRGLGRGRWNAMRVSMTTVDGLLIVAFVAVLVSGCLISRFIFKDFIPPELHRNLTLRQIHTCVSWGSLILVGLHIGFHGRALWQGLLWLLSVAEGARGARIAAVALQVVTVVLGIYGSLANQLGGRLMVKHIFATTASQLGNGVFLLLLVAIIGLYAVIGNYIQRFLRR